MLDPDDPELKGQSDNQGRSAKPPTEGDRASERITTPRIPPAMTLEGRLEREVNRSRWGMND